MKIKLKGKRINRTAKAKELWLKVATDILGGMTPQQIFDSQRYINPITKKPYSLKWIYWVVDRLNKMEV